MNKIIHNKFLETKENYIQIRKMFFQHYSLNKISKKTGITVRVLQRIRNERNLIEKRNRYYRFLIFYSYKNEISLRESSKNCGIKESSLMKFKRLSNIKTQKFNPYNKKINKDLEENMIRDYNEGLTSDRISNNYGFKTGKTVLDVLKRNNIKIKLPKKYTDYSVEYFKNIDCGKKAYIIGLLSTDGYVIKNYAGIAIQLNSVDIEILNLISNELGKSCSIIEVRPKDRLINGKYIPSTMSRLCCHSPEISKNLKEYGIIKNKTHVLEFPKNIPKEYIGSYYRGVIDGDGSVGIGKKNNYPWVSIATASVSFANGLIENLPENINAKFYYIKNKYKGIYDVRISGGRKNIREFLKWIYKDKDDFYMERKYEKIKDLIN